LNLPLVSIAQAQIRLVQIIPESNRVDPIDIVGDAILTIQWIYDLRNTILRIIFKLRLLVQRIGNTGHIPLLKTIRIAVVVIQSTHLPSKITYRSYLTLLGLLD